MKKSTLWKYFAFASFWIIFNGAMDLIFMFLGIFPPDEYRIAKTAGIFSLGIGTSLTTMIVYLIENWVVK